MAAYKPRVPGSYAEATTRVRDQIGARVCAALLGVSRSRVDAACDPDQPNYSPLSVPQAEALDAEYVRQTGQPAPIWTCMGAKLSGSPVGHDGEPIEHMADISELKNAIIQAIRQAVDPRGISGVEIAPTEALAVVRAFDAAMPGLSSIRASYAALAGLDEDAAATPLRKVS